MFAPATGTQYFRTVTQISFFTLFVLAPVLDIFRFDLIEGHFIIFGSNWTLGLSDFQKGIASTTNPAFNILTRVFLPLIFIVVAFIVSSYYWGRLYCGWLCPHYSVVETINHLMIRAFGKPSIWEKNKLPEQQADGSIQKTNKLYKLLTLLAITGFASLWAVSFLTYLLPPTLIYHNIITFQLSINQALFISVTTFLLTIEFTFARHLFCRFACAVGIFQSLSWMSHSKAHVIQFDSNRANACKTCTEACDNVCPMRLKTRTSKRKKFTCTSCLACIAACNQVQKGESLLHWHQADENTRLTTPVSLPLPKHKRKF